MNSYHTPNFFDNAKYFFNRKSTLPRLILINLSVFVLVYLIGLIFWLYKMRPDNNLPFLTYWLAVPSSVTSLLTKPWTIFTYMFLHEGLLHLVFNMIMLYFGGTIFLQYLSEKQLLGTYILGGISGAVFYILSYNTFPVFLEATPHAIALGASASVLAIVIAIAAFVPQYTVNLLLLGPVRLKYLAIAFVVIDIFSIQGNNPGGHIAHLGGAVWGFLYILLLKNNRDILSIPSILQRKKKFRVTYKNSTRNGAPGERPINDEEYNRRKKIEQQEVDKILDKISRSGYDNLTAKEKEILFKNSNRK